MYYRSFGKRTVDVFSSLIFLVILAPLFVFVGLLIRCIDGAPILFMQKRPGLHGQLFWIIKFRTMNQDSVTFESDQMEATRVTRLGNWLRRSGIDELPQLWNVLKGEMSIVGPRPLLPEYLPVYTPTQKKRHLVRPGISGLAQINKNTKTTWNERLEQDVWYVENYSMLLDLRILLRTFSTVLLALRSGNGEPQFMEHFKGTPNED